MIVVDTHALLWWRDKRPELSRRALQAIEAADRIGVPAPCCFELATLARQRRITFDRDAATWIRRATAADRVVVLPVTEEIAIEAGRLPETFPGDPVDRLVYATAVANGSRLVTRDRRITEHDPARVLW